MFQAQHLLALQHNALENFHKFTCGSFLKIPLVENFSLGFPILHGT
jgi:hypothetical protein